MNKTEAANKRREDALWLRGRGLKFRQIGFALGGVTAGRARQIVVSAKTRRLYKALREIESNLTILEAHLMEWRANV